MNELPIYNAELGDVMDGIFAVSLVEYPAVESNFLVFSKEEKKEFVNFAIENEEQHNLLGCVLRADYPIYRCDEFGNEYYINFTKDTIAKMGEKMLTEHTFNNIDLEHNCCDIPNGVTLQQLFVKDIAKGVNPIGFEDVADGSLFALYHIDSMELWDRIKSGEFKGFSVEAFLSLVKIEMNNQNKNNKQNKKNFFMSIKETLRNLLIQMGSVIATDGTEIVFEGDVLEVGTEVEVADGEYTVEDKIYVVAEGKVAEIKDVVVEETPAEEEEKPVEEEMEDETPEEPATEEPAPAEEETPNEVEALKAEIEALKADLEALKAQVAEIITEPKAEPIVEEFSKTITGKKVSKAVEYAQYLKN